MLCLDWKKRGDGLLVFPGLKILPPDLEKGGKKRKKKKISSSERKKKSGEFLIRGGALRF